MHSLRLTPRVLGACRLIPSLKKMHWVDDKKPKMVLVLDNAPCHHKEMAGCINVSNLSKLKPRKN